MVVSLDIIFLDAVIKLDHCDRTSILVRTDTLVLASLPFCVHKNTRRYQPTRKKTRRKKGNW